MKKLLFLLVATTFLLFSFSTANATLIGLTEADLAKPDVYIDGGISFDYDYTGNGTNTLIITGEDEKITMPDGTEYTLTDHDDNDPLTGFSLRVFVDNSGNLIDSDDALDMEEEVIEGPIMEASYGGGYVAGETLLTGHVFAFGWDEVFTDEARFDLLLDQVAGEWVDDGIWPSDRTIGILISTVSLSGITAWDDCNPWDTSWEITSGKADKAPIVPEPATMLLLGSGLVGLAAFGRKKFFKRS